MTVAWRKSSYSGTSTDEMCVEVAHLVEVIGIRDSKDPDGGRLAVGSDQFRELVRLIKGGDFDRP